LATTGRAEIFLISVIGLLDVLEETKIELIAAFKALKILQSLSLKYVHRQQNNEHFQQQQQQQQHPVTIYTVLNVFLFVSAVLTKLYHPQWSMDLYIVPIGTN
jgi:hypothetical protein